MNLKRLYKTLAKHEGAEKKPYKCTSGMWTVGIGRNLSQVRLSTEELVTLFDTHDIDDAFFELLLKNDVEKAIVGALYIFGKAFNNYADRRQEAIINLIFNMGVASVKGFRRMVAAIKREDWNSAADELLYTNPAISKQPDDKSVYAKQVGKRANAVATMLRKGQI